jgi:hypothetical protein
LSRDVISMYFGTKGIINDLEDNPRLENTLVIGLTIYKTLTDTSMFIEIDQKIILQTFQGL